MSIRDTNAYNGLVARLNAETAALEAELSQLAGIKRDKKATSRRSNIKALIKARQSKLLQLERPGDSLRLFKMWDLVHMEVELQGCTWSPGQLLLWDMPLAIHEGRGEKSLRDKHGLPQEVTQGAVDLHEINEEAKNWNGRDSNGSDSIQSIRIGKVGKSVYGRACRNISRSHPDSVMPEAQWDSLFTGEVTPGMLYHDLPHGVSRVLLDELAPSKVLGHYAAINGCSRLGYLRIPVEDVDRAWRLCCVTQMSPKYELRREYVEGLLLARLILEAASGRTSGGGTPPLAAS